MVPTAWAIDTGLHSKDLLCTLTATGSGLASACAGRCCACCCRGSLQVHHRRKGFPTAFTKHSLSAAGLVCPSELYAWFQGWEVTFLAHLGSFLNGLAGPVAMAAGQMSTGSPADSLTSITWCVCLRVGPTCSNVWFPASQRPPLLHIGLLGCSSYRVSDRTTATAVAAVLNVFGDCFLVVVFPQ